MDAITIRTAVPADLDAVAQVEAACFPAAEAADRKSLKERLDVFPQSGPGARGAGGLFLPVRTG